jgi:predicted aconitase
MRLTDHERAVLSGETGTPGDRIAMRIVTEAAQMLGASELVVIHSAHIDGCLYHGDSGVLFCEKLVAERASVKVPSTTNVGAMNLLKRDQVHLPSKKRDMALRLMTAHEQLGCSPSWTCAPYQAGARPENGQQIAWGESNAVAFANTVLGARTNRYGDFLDIACAISARAPYYGLHQPENRRAQMLIDVSALSSSLLSEDAFFPVLGSLIGRLAGETVCVVDGLPGGTSDDQLKAMCAAAASTGAVGLIHVAGSTPEAPDAQTALGGLPPTQSVQLSTDMVVAARDQLGTTNSEQIDCVALGSPHFSIDECRALLAAANGQRFNVPVYVCTGRHTMQALAQNQMDQALIELGVEFVVDTCVVVTPILPAKSGVMMTNSGKFAHYATGNTGYAPVFGSLSDCVKSAQSGKVVWDRSIWQ